MLHKKMGKWQVRQHCRSADFAKAAIRLLQGLDKRNKRKK